MLGKKESKKSTEDLESSIASRMFENEDDITDDNETTVDETVAEKGKQQDGTFDKVVEVDFWMTNLHGAEVGIYQKDRFMAKNRAFSRNLDLIGAVRDEGKPDGMFGFDKESWLLKLPDSELSKQRLIIKWFNSQSVAHLGTIEELVVSSIASSFGANDTLASFKMIIPKYDYVVDLKKEHTRLKMGEIFTFALKGKDGFWQAFAFDEKRLTVGSDWEVKLAGREAPVALIDQKLLNIGSKFVIHFFDKELYKNLTFYRVVLLFAMMLRFKDDLFAKIEKMKDLIKKGKLKIDVGQSEERLFYNPRILRK